MAKYVGITLGPIGDTMLLTSTPAGLWAASYLFSYLAHEIRAQIGKDGLVQDDLVYDETNEVSSLWNRGVGLYHDRIIYEADENHTLEKAAKAVGNAVDSVISGFASSDEFKNDKDEIKRFFDSYFNIHMVCLDVEDGGNFLLKVNEALDAAELEKNFPATISSNPILRLFDGTLDGNDDKKNEVIKKSFLVAGKKEWVLLRENGTGIKDLGSIAICREKGPYDKKDKAAKYYAVIRADGDNMGKTPIEKIKNEDNYIDFSKKCFRYGCHTAEIVLGFGGIPIYVGGDDLLCIVPLMSKDKNGKQTFLDMISRIRKAFKKEFPGEPDLSFGVQIQYVKAPLYEALNESGRLLFGTAKTNKPGALAVNLRKHSGQSAEVLIKGIGGEKGEKIRKALDELILKHASEDTLKSVGKHIEDFAALFNKAGIDGDQAIDHFFENMFDNGVSDEDRKYIEQIRDLAKYISACSGKEGLADKLSPYIRLIKFFSEDAGKEERDI